MWRCRMDMPGHGWREISSYQAGRIRGPRATTPTVGKLRAMMAYIPLVVRLPPDTRPLNRGLMVRYADSRANCPWMRLYLARNSWPLAAIGRPDPSDDRCKGVV